MTIAELTTFFGWMSIINIGFLFFAFISITAFRNFVTKIHSIIFGVNAQDLRKIYLQFLANYKIFIIIFNVVPYITLKIMFSWI